MLPEWRVLTSRSSLALRPCSAGAPLLTIKRGNFMKIILKVAGAAGFLALAACNNSGNTAAENAAQNITDAAENRADAVENMGENAYDAAQNQADQIRDRADNRADAITDAAGNAASDATNATNAH